MSKQTERNTAAFRAVYEAVQAGAKLKDAIGRRREPQRVLAVATAQWPGSNACEAGDRASCSPADIRSL